MDALVAAAKKEGQLTTIALPHDWCGYGAVIDGFKAKYGLKINELNPDAGSGDEIEAIKANKGNMGPQAPDVIDVGLSFGPSAKKEGLIQPYKVATWDSIPDSAKDAEGHWYGDYYGVLAFEVNADIIKKVAAGLGGPAWARLQERGSAGRGPARIEPGDPGCLRRRIVGGGRRWRQGWRGGSEILRRAQQGGQLRAGHRQGGSAGSGVDADHHPLGLQCAGRPRHSEGQPQVEVVVPKSGVVAGVYVQAISAYAPHPNAAKLWMEYLYSDEGQLVWLAGYCHPIRFNDLVKNGKVPQDAPGQAAAGCILRESRVPDAGRAGAGEGSHHQAVGHRRRRERPVTRASRSRGRQSFAQSRDDSPDLFYLESLPPRGGETLLSGRVERR